MAEAPLVVCDNTKSQYRCNLQQLLLCISEKGTEELNLAVPEHARDLPRPWKQSHCPETQTTALQNMGKRAAENNRSHITESTQQRTRLQAEQLLNFRTFISFPSGCMQREGAKKKNQNTKPVSIPQDIRSGNSKCVTCQTRVYLVDKKLLSHFSQLKGSSKAA